MADNDKITIKRQGDSIVLSFAGKDMIISESEALLIRDNPSLVYDIIVAHNRRFYFNASEDTIIPD